VAAGDGCLTDELVGLCELADDLDSQRVDQLTEPGQLTMQQGIAELTNPADSRDDGVVERMFRGRDE
jgi:hypothetical protein